MNIQSTVRITKINQQNNVQIQKLVVGKEQIAWSEDIDKDIPFTGHKQAFALTGTPYLRTFSLDKKQRAADTRKLRQEYITLTKTACDLAGQCFPSELDKPIEGIQFLIASAEAFDAWTDNNKDYVLAGTLATGKAFIDAYELIEPYFPVLQQYSTQKQVAGLLLKIADHVYVLQKQHNSL